MTDLPGGDPTRAPSSSAPPLFMALAGALRERRSGTIAVVCGEDRVAVQVREGRVTGVTHPDAGPAAVVDLLRRSGFLTDRQVVRAERLSRKTQTLPDDALVEVGAVSAGTVANVRELLCREALLDLVLRRDVEVQVSWTLLRGAREMCLLAIPFLLKEAQRRAQDTPAVRQVVTSPAAIFGRTAVLDHPGKAEHWEDLKLPVAERQVYFFIDGRRSVADLALATCQSEFDVGRALRSLAGSGLARAVGAGATRSAAQVVSRSALLRALSLFAAVAVLVAALATGVWINFIEGSGAAGRLADPFRQVAADAPSRRIAAALRLYRLTFARPAESFNDLLSEGMVMPTDARAAVVFSVGDRYLLGGNEAGDDARPKGNNGPERPDPRTEDDGKAGR